MSRPLIGMTTYRQHATWGVWSEDADLLPASYADAIRAAGGLPVMLPPGASDPVAEAAVLVARLDGIVLTGGADVDPARYGADPHETTDRTNGVRDAWEVALAEAALAEDRALLGVCRGMQVLNTVRGGTLIQHLPETVGNEAHRPALGSFGRHRVTFAGGTRLRAMMGAEADVATHHHQAVDGLGSGLVATGWADDGTVEALELPEAYWTVAVQWHPEVDRSGRLLASFVSASAARAAVR